MNLRKAREIVVLAGKQLVESGLIARTWGGNVSCRISETQFVITPSGRAYETLTPDEIVLVNIEDCSYVGNLKPSSEKESMRRYINAAGILTLSSTLTRSTPPW